MRLASRLVVLCLSGVLAAGALADVSTTHSLVQATVGGSVTVTASSADPGAYTLSIADTHPAQGVICSDKVAGPIKAVKGRLRATGKVPAGIACYASDGTVLSHAKMSAGTYTLFLCQADGPTGCDGSHTVIRNQVLVKLAPARDKPKSPKSH